MIQAGTFGVVTYCKHVAGRSGTICLLELAAQRKTWHESQRLMYVACRRGAIPADDRWDG